MGFFKKSALRHRDDKRTRAAELTLRESIYPLCLVTILFFLWASYLHRGSIRKLS
jgi:FHS family L-fucose permease-like MFS transporter